MGLRKYKYYFKKPRSEIAKDIFNNLLVAGVIYVAGYSPFFINNIIKVNKKWQRYPKRKIQDTFYRLKKQGFITIEEKSHEVKIYLTQKGKKKAGWMQIDSLKIKSPKKWDRKWRLVIFDIAQLKKLYRDAFRGKLKELGFLPLQKSVWIHPFNCEAEIELLREFFGLNDREIRLITAEKIGDDEKLKHVFRTK